MNIACLISEYPTVSSTFILREVAELRRRGITVETFATRAPGRREWMSPDDAAALASTFYIFPMKKLRLCRAHLAGFARRPVHYLMTLRKSMRHRPPGLRGALASVAYFAEAIYLADELRRRRVGHLHNHFGNAAGNVAYLASYYLGLTWSLTVHGASGFDYPSGLLIGDKIRSSQFTACVSQFVKAQAQRCVEPKHWHKLFINHCGVDLATFPAHSGAPDPGKIRLLSVGRLSPEKAIPGLLEAFAEIRRQGLPAELAIVGDGPERSKIESRIAELNLGDSCKLLGFKSSPDVLAEMSRSDIFVMSSLMEGLPVVLMEALGVGLPAVAPCVAGIPEIIEHGRTGLLYVVGDWGDLATSIARLIADPELRRRLAHNGRQRVVDAFAVRRAAEPIAERLLALAERRTEPDAPAERAAGAHAGRRPGLDRMPAHR
jgi:colanic acid/amylovoran biosynthesis glycosyltransferase